MDIADRNRLLKLIGMLGSEHDGERANAAAFIQKMATERKLTITELMAEAHSGHRQNDGARPNPQPHAKPQSPFGDPIDPEPSFTDVNSPLLGMMKQVAGRPDRARRVLTDWEVNFVTDVSGRYEYDTQLSEKQLVIVERVLQKASRVFTW